MISILICGYNETYERNIKANILQTIGCEHEILYYKNSEQKGICEVYNLLSQKALGDVLCFIHEDTEILTSDWGILVEEALSRFDLIGIAGSQYKSKTPSTMGVNQYYCWNIHQAFKYRNDAKNIITVFHENHPEQDIEEAVCLDGVFLCIKKESMLRVQFDDINFPSFHGYDYDFCFSAVQQHLKLGVIKSIKLIHFSEGDTNPKWIDAQINLFHKWKQLLPIYTSDIRFSHPRYLEFLAFKQFLFKMRDNKYYKVFILLRLFHPLYFFYWLRYYAQKHFFSKKSTT